MTFFATAKQLRKIESDNLNEGNKRKQNTRARVKDNIRDRLIEVKIAGIHSETLKTDRFIQGLVNTMPLNTGSTVLFIYK